MRAGDTVVTPAGEWHWHGAARTVHDAPRALGGARRRRPRDRVERPGHRPGVPCRSERRPTGDHLDTPTSSPRIGRATELEVASRVCADGSLRSFVTIWAVRIGDDIFVRSAYGYDNPWFQRAM